MTQWLVYITLGSAVGFLSGLLGVGGGLLIVPVLLMVFQSLEFAGSILTQLAIGTSLATINITGLSSTLKHYRLKGIDFQSFYRLAPGVGLGALVGGLVAGVVSGHLLQIGIGLLALFAAIKMLSGWSPKQGVALPGTVDLVGVGGFIGFCSSLCGIGGGTLTVPYLSWRRLPMQKAIGTSAACGLPIACMGVIGFIVSGWQQQQLPPYCLGYVYVPAFVGIVLSSVVTAQWGAYCAHKLPVPVIKRCFSVLLLLLGVKLLGGF